MTAHTLAARETVREIRESLSRVEPMVNVLKADLDVALSRLAEYTGMCKDEPDYEAIELWARLAADLAGMIQQREKVGK